jgi:DNA mismatch repair protein MutS2
MDHTVLHTLEYHKIIEMLAERAGSTLGKEFVRALKPVSDMNQVISWQEETKEARNLLDATLILPLGGIRDIRSLVKRCQLGGFIDPSELLQVSSTLAAARRVKSFFSDIRHSMPRLAAKSDALITLRQIENAIENIVNEHGSIRDDASVELYRIRREIKQIQGQIKDKIDSILHSAEYQKYFQEVLVTIRGDRYVIPVKQEYRSQFPGIVHDQSASGATVFIEPIAVVNLNNDLKQAMGMEKNEIERILSMVSAQIAKEASPVYQNCDILGEFDLVNAKARLSIDLKAEMPVVNRQGIVNIRKGRHPLIPEDAVVPIDIHLGREFAILLITGPNTGGKTVSLKTTGLFALMAQSGLFIPAEYGSELPVFDNIYADIGDEQSIEQSLSTFSAHMTNLIRILRRISVNDLVLIDEIGAGTDPDEGAALAMAILDYLYSRGSKVIATTHYSELKTFAYTRHGIENASVEFDVQTLRPTYRLLIGVPGSSNALAISKRLGLDENIIEKATHFLSKEHLELEELLSGLQEKKKEYTKRNEEIASLEYALRSRQAALEDEQDAVAAKRSEILGKAKEDASAILRQARREADSVIGQLKAQFTVNSERERLQAINEARKRLRAGANELAQLDEGEHEKLPAAAPGTLKPGNTVYITTLKQKGTVVAVSGNEVTVQLGILKVNVPLTNCRSVAEVPNPTKINTVKSEKEIKISTAVREADVRGMTVDEAVDILEKFLDDAVLAGLHEVIVIHGKGTGALRKGIRAYLAGHPHVKSTVIGEFNQGGDGVTVVKLA